MATRTQSWMAAAVMTAGLLGFGRDAAAGDATAMARIRTSNRTIAALIAAAKERSATFNGLVETIEGSDGIVYIEHGVCGHGVRACLLQSVTLAGRNRVLHVLVDTGKRDRDLQGSIGHELRHATEVLSNRSLTTDSAIYFFYQRTGRKAGGGVETDAAVSAGHAVYAEMRRAQAHPQSH